MANLNLRKHFFQSIWRSTEIFLSKKQNRKFLHRHHIRTQETKCMHVTRFVKHFTSWNDKSSGARLWCLFLWRATQRVIVTTYRLLRKVLSLAWRLSSEQVSEPLHLFVPRNAISHTIISFRLHSAIDQHRATNHS